MPHVTDVQLEELYEQSDSSSWTYEHARRRDWELAAALITPSSSVLDIGCASGDFLARYGASWQKYGIELRDAAARTATSRGVHVLGKSLDDVPAGRRFDAVTAFDILEHLADPLGLMNQCSSILNSGGIFICSTGDVSTWPFRIVRARHYYPAMPEHVSILSKKAVERMASENGACLVRMTNFSRADAAGGLGIVVESVKAITYALSPTLFNSVRNWRRRRLDREADYRPPVWSSPKDHLFAAIQTKAPR